jgi:hypothetical protein
VTVDDVDEAIELVASLGRSDHRANDTTTTSA